MLLYNLLPSFSFNVLITLVSAVPCSVSRSQTSNVGCSKQNCLQWRRQGHVLCTSYWEPLSCDVVLHESRDCWESCSRAAQSVAFSTAAYAHMHETTSRSENKKLIIVTKKCNMKITVKSLL